MNTDIFAPMPPMESLESRIARQVARDYARNPLWSIPRPGHPAFVGPVAQPRGTGHYDPRPNVPGVTFWGD